MLQPGRDERVERAVQRRVGHRSNVLRHDRRDVVERPQRPLAVLDGSRPARDHRDERVAVPILRDERERGRDLERRERAHLLGGVGDVLAEEPQDVLGLVELVEHRSAVDVLDRVEPELEGGHDPEVPAAPADRPEQVVVFGRARDEEPPVGGHHVGRDQVVARQAEPARQVPDPAAEREAGDPGRRDDPAGRRQAERVRRGVEISPRGPTLGPRRARRRVDANAPHSREIDHNAFVAGPEPRHAVPAAADGQVESALAREGHRRDHVAGVHGANDHGRPSIDHRVVDLPRLLVPPVPGHDHVAPHPLAQLVDRERPHGSLLRSDRPRRR